MGIGVKVSYLAWWCFLVGGAVASGGMFAVRAPARVATIDFGINVCGAEFGEARLPGIPGQDYIYPDEATLAYFLGRGFRVQRLPFRWERLQRRLGAELDAGELSRLAETVRFITDAGGQVILDVHNFARYHGQVIGSEEVGVADFADLWARLAGCFRLNDRVIFGLMSEPHGLPVATWLAAANAALAAIRSAGASNLVLVPGANWSGAFSWHDDWGYGRNSELMAGVVDPGRHFAYEVHLYFDRDNSGTSSEVVSRTVGRVCLEGVAAWCRRLGRTAYVAEIGAPDHDEGLAALADTLDYLCREGADVYRGCVYWAAGPWWPRGHLFIVQPVDVANPAEPPARQLQILKRYMPVNRP